jgi:tetratricopeptide (TPR) repeat protein
MEAVRYYDRANEIYPEFDDSIWDRGMALAFAGKKDDAMAAFRKRGELNKIRDWTPGCVEWALLGDKQKTKEAIARNSLSNLEHARAFALIGEIDSAIAALEKAYAERDPQLMFMKVDRRLTNLRGDNRFQDLVRKVGL